MMKGKDKSYIDVYIKGQYGYTKEGKPVYEMCYNDNLHVSEHTLIPEKSREIVVTFCTGASEGMFSLICNTGLFCRNFRTGTCHCFMVVSA